MKPSEVEILRLKAYLKKMRKTNVPTLNEITQIVEQVRIERYAKNINR